jgi:uncharacterized membrane protein YfcA
MSALAPPALLLALFLSVAYASIFHFWGGRTLRDLLLYLAAGIVGFAAGQLLGMVLQSDLLRVGDLFVLEASILAWLALIGTRELTKPRS